MKYIVTKPTVVTLDGQKYLLEVGDKICLNEDVQKQNEYNKIINILNKKLVKKGINKTVESLEAYKELKGKILDIIKELIRENKNNKIYRTNLEMFRSEGSINNINTYLELIIGKLKAKQFASELKLEGIQTQEAVNAANEAIKARKLRSREAREAVGAGSVVNKTGEGETPDWQKWQRPSHRRDIF